MIINYFGKQFFKIVQGEKTLSYNPISKDSKQKGALARFGADLVLISINHPDYNGIETVTHGALKPFEIKGPGEYEVGGISVIGLPTEIIWQKKNYINTIYLVLIDQIKICFLGGLSKDLEPANREIIGNPDIIFTPVGGDFLSPEEAYKLVISLEPKIIIPMDYTEADLKIFLKESGDDKIEPLDKLTVKMSYLEGKEGEVVILKQQ